MAKKFPQGRCIHCLEEFSSLTSDHVFPDSWYPETTPDNLEKWQMPDTKNDGTTLFMKIKNNK